VPICFSREVREEQEMMDSATAQAWVKAKYTQQAVTSRPETKSRGLDSGKWHAGKCLKLVLKKRKTGNKDRKMRLQLRSFCTEKETDNNVKRQPAEQEVFANRSHNNEEIARVYRELKQLDRKRK
jgi:hypothetical protein